jgi:hypothetical protein
MHTYLFKSKWFNKNGEIDGYFQERGNWKPYDEKSGKVADFIYLDGPFIYEHPDLHKIKANIKNLLDTKKYVIADKGMLYNNMKKYDADLCKRFMMAQHYVTKDNYTKVIPKSVFTGTNAWILKPIAGHSGIGISVFTSYDEFIRCMNEHKKSHDQYIRKGWVLAEYISNPLLFMDRKFHLRVYFLYTAIDGEQSRGYILKKGKFFPAKKPFVSGNYDDKEIHDSHYYEEIGFYIFPEEFTSVYGENRWATVFNQILDLGSVLTKLMHGTKGYEESKNNYEVFALDVMVLDDFSIKLLEVNTKVGYACEQADKCVPFNEYLMQSQFEVTIDKIFEPAKKLARVDGYVDVTDRSVSKGGYYKKYIKYKHKYLALKNSE